MFFGMIEFVEAKVKASVQKSSLKRRQAGTLGVGAWACGAWFPFLERAYALNTKSMTLPASALIWL
ncbi:hypothetical protein AXE65_11150 [Ventosimonas gracilis]|uniref:Uncharacterized protein n=1 Tax=Ventosimonas gracilis TaxID=1680762 RepID=A0A139SX12_9GAMM|nr:hypothetical protein AXE65_11150 [Ventosimonas gracilis]